MTYLRWPRFFKKSNTDDGFNSLGLTQELLNSLSEKGYLQPTPIQEKVIPPILAGHDVMAIAQTGTGKTAGFTLPILHLLSIQDVNSSQNTSRRLIRCLILVPTRELASQILTSLDGYAKYLNVKSTVVFGGVNQKPQVACLKKGVDVLVATPGRLLDLYRQEVINFNDIETLVLDEADRMLDMGFIHDIRALISKLPKTRQTLFFSATFSKDIQSLAKRFLTNPLEISVTPKNSAASTVKQSIYSVDQKQKFGLLYELISTNEWIQVLVFTRTKHRANKLTRFLEKKGINVGVIHGNKSQAARTRVLDGFKSGAIQVLVATDIASRGLDIHELPHVVNFDLPHVPEDYVHRIGRTGRAGSDGHAISLVSADETKQLKNIERLIKIRLTREFVKGFDDNDQKTLDQSNQKKPTIRHKKSRFKTNNTVIK